MKNRAIISIVNLKGGAGKTTIATNLAVAFSLTGKKVLLIDTDKQESALSWCGQREVATPKVNVISLTDPKALKKQIADFAAMYDLIIVDGAPQVDLMAATTIALSDLIIIPVSPSPYDIWATEAITQRIGEAQAVNPTIKAKFLVNCFSERANISQETFEALQSMELETFATKIGNRVVYADTVINGLSVMETSKNLKAQKEIGDLVCEIEKVLND